MRRGSITKSFIAAIAFVAFFDLAGVSFADDSGPMPEFLLKQNKITCVSVINPEDVGENYFLVFDYSSSIGQQMGKPWAIVESGKCYQVDANGGDIYRVQRIIGNEPQQFENYSAYKSTDDIAPTFCHDTGKYGLCSDYKSITKGFVLSPDAVTFSQADMVYSSGLYVTDLFPTKYVFGYPITFGIAFGSPPGEGMQKVLDDPSFIKLDNLYHSLTKELENTLQSCDTRTRVEYQYKVGPTADRWGEELFIGLKNIVWRFADGHDVLFDASKRMDASTTIETIGCKPAFDAFITAHQTDFENMDSLTGDVDKLVQETKKEYPGLQDEQLDEVRISLRDTNSVIGSVDTILSSTTDSGANFGSTSPVLVEDSSTSLDEPANGMKTDVPSYPDGQSTNPYIFIPLIALCGALVFSVIRSRNRISDVASKDVLK